MQGMSKADEQRRARDVAAIRAAAPDATSLKGLAQAAGIRYPRLYNLLEVMEDGEQIRAGVAAERRRRRARGGQDAAAR